VDTNYSLFLKIDKSGLFATGDKVDSNVRISGTTPGDLAVRIGYSGKSRPLVAGGHPVTDIGIGVSVERSACAGKDFLDVTTAARKLRIEVGPTGLHQAANLAAGLGLAMNCIGKFNGFRLTSVTPGADVLTFLDSPAAAKYTTNRPLDRYGDRFDHVPYEAHGYSGADYKGVYLWGVDPVRVLFDYRKWPHEVTDRDLKAALMRWLCGPLATWSEQHWVNSWLDANGYPPLHHAPGPRHKPRVDLSTIKTRFRADYSYPMVTPGDVKVVVDLTLLPEPLRSAVLPLTGGVERRSIEGLLKRTDEVWMEGNPVTGNIDHCTRLIEPLYRAVAFLIQESNYGRLARDFGV
jgi:hypothetical protein